MAAGPIPERHGGSKFIVRPMAATLIGDGVAMDLQFIKNRRLIVQGWDPAATILSKESDFFQDDPGVLNWLRN